MYIIHNVYKLILYIQMKTIDNPLEIDYNFEGMFYIYIQLV